MPEEFFERRTAFNAGEISPWLDPRIDQEKYHLGCRQMRNMRPTVYGGAFKRPGTTYLGEARIHTGTVRLLSFQYEVGKVFVLELTDERMRIWETGATPALVEDPDSPGDPLVVTTPWAEDELNALQVAQLNDLLFVVHPDHQPRVIARYEDDDWRVVKYNPDWPALLAENDTVTTLAATANNATASRKEPLSRPGVYPRNTFPCWPSTTVADLSPTRHSATVSLLAGDILMFRSYPRFFLVAARLFPFSSVSATPCGWPPALPPPPSSSCCGPTSPGSSLTGTSPLLSTISPSSSFLGQRGSGIVMTWLDD